MILKVQKISFFKNNSSTVSFFRLMQKSPEEEALESSRVVPRKIFKIRFRQFNVKRLLRALLIAVTVAVLTYAAMNLIFKVLPAFAVDKVPNAGDKAGAGKNKKQSKKSRPKRKPAPKVDYSQRVKDNFLPGEGYDYRIGHNGEYLNKPDSLPTKINERVNKLRGKFGLEVLGKPPSNFYQPSLYRDVFPVAFYIGLGAGLAGFIFQEFVIYFNKGKYPKK